MKKLFALLLLSGLFTFTSCDSKKTSENEEVVDTDTTAVEVEKTVVETDTTVKSDTTTKTDEVETEKK
jgi:hypothetical protein